ncbi:MULTISPECIES: threonine ammonia-lyase [Rhodococcus]|jgi:threonine dehydratase|uniref:threonine ammonia-lyase n=1 Tax=Rhodococcus oxybenzonivorans TaxID=1990687 RepID=A0AAE4UYJ2_9NOCA|nr:MULTISPECIES: threonine ammonia-lyase [Rhodococcus]MDV7246532.1 threonine ammonia-lyase [Rhodococcus oxybenzonivorans]MDV7264528.1 threonine ammonia-lyase [Rhodococcus oxybenzonivorans]MDV7278154.1 threonine ammonia-lyase [Rhodococcus oxybenzonivorans]MDV7337533.1 threonine ammonia-lyase [Rhodococcus oxybenzonivorans]MDV7347742.1 threonine ammonia-lyase [Rhodococcus oxybenzonivorans]
MLARVESVTLEQIRAARRLLAPVMRRTPVIASRALSERCGHEVSLKCENLQRTGSFKPRGAYYRIANLAEEERASGVVAASAGNHAQGVAWAATDLGIASTVFMPTGAPLPKLVATKAYGATVHLTGDTVDDALVAAKEFAAETGAVLIHPFDHVDIVAGQGTVGLEILEQEPDVGTIVVPTGGGGLIAGIAAAVSELRPDVRIIGVQAEQAAAWPASLAEGRPVPLANMSTMADGIAVGRPGDVPFAHVGTQVDAIVTVSEDALSRALLLCLERAKLIVEPAGAAAVAALISCAQAELGLTGKVCAVLSGGNVDPLLLTHVVNHGLRASGRYLGVHVTIPDRPGGLVGLLEVVSGNGASVVDVVHSRTGGSLALDEVEVFLTVETRGPGHRQDLLDALDAAGYAVRLQH